MPTRSTHIENKGALTFKRIWRHWLTADQVHLAWEAKSTAIRK